MAASAAPGSRVVVATTEHKAVLDTAAALEADGFKVEEIAVDRLGILDLARLEAALDEDVALVSVMLANNETGVIQPLGRIAKLLLMPPGLSSTPTPLRPLVASQ